MQAHLLMAYSNTSEPRLVLTLTISYITTHILDNASVDSYHELLAVPVFVNASAGFCSDGLCYGSHQRPQELRVLAVPFSIPFRLVGPAQGEQLDDHTAA